MTKRIPFSRKRRPLREDIVYPRADPAALALFDPRTKTCTMNCGPASGDPRTQAERKFLCDDCIVGNYYEVK